MLPKLPKAPRDKHYTFPNTLRNHQSMMEYDIQ
ncbi:hypothetical protein A2U01_0062096, partial [Trifolium medium]|nr:hypothetical protein [Trifolium medium]